MINLFRSFLNRNYKIYVIVNNKVADKGKLSRCCFTIGQLAPHMRFSKVVVLRGDSGYDITLDLFKTGEARVLGLQHNYRYLGEHKDAGLTQVLRGTSLAFGIVVHNNINIDLKLY